MDVNQYPETLDNSTFDEFVIELVHRVASETAIKLDHEWILITPSTGLAIPLHGWKLHISACISDAHGILKAVVPILIEKECAFKIIRTPQLLRKINSGILGISQIGKFITVYPANEVQAVELASLLDAQTQNFIGPIVPSDRPLHRNSLIFYRYGAFLGSYLQLATGETVHAIPNRLGDLVPDLRRSKYIAPEDIPDPFSNDPPKNTEVSVVADRYLAIMQTSRTARGPVLFGHDLKENCPCVIKQAPRRNQVSLPDFEPHQMLRREYETLLELKTIEVFPIPRDFVEDEENCSLIMSYLEGKTLYEYIIETIAASGSGVNATSFRIAKEISTNLQKIHTAGLVYRDLKPTNIIILTNGDVRFVDAEHVYSSGTVLPSGVGTRGYMSKEQLAGGLARQRADLYGLGAVLFYLFSGKEASQSPDPGNLIPKTIGLAYPGLPESLLTLIKECLDLDSFPSLRLSEVIERLKPRNSSALIRYKVCRDSPGEHPGPLEAVSSICQNLVDSFYRSGPNEGCWKSSHPLSANPHPSDIAVGTSGILLALSNALGSNLLNNSLHKSIIEVIGVSGSRIRNVFETEPPKLPGLYVGGIGIALALGSISRIAGDNALRRSATAISQIVADTPHRSPDLYNGSAGRLRGHLLLWKMFGTPEQLKYAEECGDFLMSSVGDPRDPRGWTIPDGFGGLSGNLYLGYAHGVAGIADTLIDLYDCTGNLMYLNLATEVGIHLLDRANISGKDWVYWSSTEDSGNAAMPYWCHGAAGIALFLVRLNSRVGNSDIERVARMALETTYVGSRVARPTYCHGLSSAIDILIEASVQLKDERYLVKADNLFQLMADFAVSGGRGLVFSTEGPEVVTPDLLVGYSGLLAPALRLKDPHLNMAIPLLERFHG